jgi:hypothetical protein
MSKIYPLPTFDGTHHISKSGKPAYFARFIEVGKFHEPGLAPVCDKTGWYHITTGGNPAYTQRYLKVWGFYCGRAAALDENGWMHLDAKGNPAYLERYIWAGNFQENLCTVQTIKGFTHIDKEGENLYSELHAYAGDFHDGVAVIRDISTLSCRHINRIGEFIHNYKYDNLDVFHKGHARAYDATGWFHINLDGTPCYKSRFKTIEPFYNEQSLAQTFGNKFVRINHMGDIVDIIKGKK